MRSHPKCTFAPRVGEEGWVGEMGNKHEYIFSFLGGAVYESKLTFVIFVSRGKGDNG